MNFGNLIGNINYLRYAVGISMMINGFPIIFFVRDTLGIGPASSVFTGAFFGLALLLMMPPKLKLVAFKPNILLFQFTALFFGILLYYFFFINNSGKAVADIVNFAYTFAFFFLLLYVPNDIQKTLLVVLFLMSFVNNLTLIYSLITNPSWTLGMRAAVTFANEDAQQGGNPHLAARNALVCLLSGYALIREFKNMWIKTFLMVSLVFSLCVMILTQSKSCLLGTGIIIATHAVFRLRPASIASGVRQLFTLRSLVVLIALLGFFRYLIHRYNNIYGIIINYWDVLAGRFEDVIFTAFQLETSEDVAEDASAMGRVASFDFLKEAIYDPEVLIVGNGYKYEFMDVPPIEMLANHGIVGCLVFCLLNFFFLMFSIRDIRQNKSSLAIFTASFFMYFPALLISSGRPYDITYWFPYVFFARFLGLPYLSKNLSSPNQSLSGRTTLAS
ncbi:hypothetical protein GCM10023091_39010 [Ravibacter arvi]|uniref:O-antigen ligase-like membrane protein n=1 Tax=Ravibacter arvi TaxID=2051041 RepID=A0ABP8MBG5_9BACT